MQFSTSFLSLSKPFFCDHLGATWRIRDTIFTFYSENGSKIGPLWSPFNPGFSSFRRPCAPRPPKSNKITFLLIWDGFWTHLGWILIDFGKILWRILVDFFVDWWCNPSVKRQHHDNTNDGTTKRQNNEATNEETTKRRRPSVNLS